MGNNVIEKSELELTRSLHEAKKYIDNMLLMVKSISDEINRYRLSEGFYKKFKEEYIPIFNYLVLKYGYDVNLKFTYVGVGNQGYDAEVLINGNPLRIEITYLTLGKESKKRSKELINEGYSIRIGDPRIQLSDYYDLINETATKKSLKHYGDTLLILYLPCENVYVGDYILPKESFEKMVSDLKGKQYNTKRVDLFIPEKSVINNLGERKIPPEIHRIK